MAVTGRQADASLQRPVVPFTEAGGSGLQIEFGYHLDGGSWSGREAALGFIRTGPEGLLSILETRSGLLARVTEQPARIARLYSVLEQMDHAQSWFHHSFITDGWATAARLLTISDELREAAVAARVLENQGESGTHPTDELTTRIAGMIGVARAADVIPGGQAERFARVLEELTRPEDQRIAGVLDLEIAVDLPEGYLPPIWQAILKTLHECGSQIRYAPEDESGEGSTPSTTILKTRDEWEAAHYAAAYLSPLITHRETNADTTDHADLALLVSGDAGALDTTLSRYGLPATGTGRSSAARWQLQILPALAATFWQPVDPHAIAEFLQLASGIIRRDSAAAILHALENHPGVGGESWKGAIEKIRAAGGEEEADRLHTYFAGELFTEEDGIPVSILAERLTWLRSQLGKQLQESEIAGVAVAQIKQLEQAVRILRPDPTAKVTRPLLESILRSVIHPVSAAAPESAAPWAVCRSIEGVRPETRRLLWWSPVDSRRSAVAMFHHSEIATLAAHGYVVETPSETRRRQRYYAKRLLTRGPRELLLILPERIRGEQAEPHPLVGELLLSAPDQITEIDTRSADTEMLLFGSSLSRQRVYPDSPAGAETTVTVRPGTIPFPGRLSYSGINSLLGCPMQWTLRSRARLRRTYGHALPTGNQMLGTLTHKIVETLVSEHLQDGLLPKESGRLAGELFDRLLPEMAAEMLLPGKHLQRERAKDTITGAVAALEQTVRRLGLLIVQSEQSLHAPWKLSVGNQQIDIDLNGFADLELTDAAGAPFVLDLKYSYGRKHYTALVERGEAIQLATYARLIEHHRSRSARGAGYFLLPTGSLITSSELAGEQALEATRTTDEVWKQAEKTVAGALTAVGSRGEVMVTGLLEQEPDADADTRRQQAEGREEIYQEPPCTFCDFGVICGLTRGQP